MKRRLLILLALGLTAIGCEILDEDISGARIRVLAPVAGAEVPEGTVVFTWEALDNASGYVFTLVSPSFDAAGQVVADTVIYADTLARHFGCRAVLAPGPYEWRIQGFNSGYESRSRQLSLTVTAVQTEEP